jgi:hypothetical protein
MLAPRNQNKGKIPTPRSSIHAKTNSVATTTRINEIKEGINKGSN